MYDGVIVLSDYWTNDAAVIEFDKDLVYVNVDDSEPESGSVRFNAVADKGCWLDLSYNASYTVDSFYEYYTQEFYSDPKYFDEVSSTELTSRELSTGVTVYEFDLYYRRKDAENGYNLGYFVVDTGNGVIAGVIDKDHDLKDREVLPYEDFLNAVFVDVY